MKKLLGLIILSFVAIFTFTRAGGGGGSSSGGSTSVYQTPSATVVSISQIPQQNLKVGGTFDEGYHFRMVVNVTNTTDISMGLADRTGVGNRSMASSGNTLFVISEAGVGSSQQVAGHLQNGEFTDTVRVKGKNQIIIDIFYKIPEGSAGGEYKSIYKIKLANNPYGEVTLVAKGQDRNYYYSSGTTYEVGRLQVKAGDTNVTVNGFTLSNIGSLDVKKYLNDVVVLKDNVALNNVSFSTSNDKLLISFDPDTIQAKSTSLYVIKIKLDDLDKFAQTIQYKIANDSDFNAVDPNTNIPVEFVGGFEEVLLQTYKFNGDKITLSNRNIGSTVYASVGSNDILIAEGTVTLDEPIKLNDFTIETSEEGIENLRIVVNGDEYDSTPSSGGKDFIFHNVYIEESGTIKFIAAIKNDNALTDTTIEILTPSFGKALLTDGVNIGRYDNYNERINASNLVGTIHFAKINVETAQGSLSNMINKDYEVKQSKTTNGIVVFEGEYSARRQAVSLNEFTVNMVSPATLTGSNDYITFHLFVDGEEVQIVDMDSTTGTVSEFFDEVAVAGDEKVAIKLVADVYLSNTTKYQFNLELKGQDENGNPVGIADANTRKLDVLTQGSVVVDDNVLHPRKTVVKTDTNVTLASFVIKAGENSSLTDLESFTFEAYTGGTTGNSIATGDLRIKVDGQERDASFTGGIFTVGGLNVDLADGVVVEIIRKGTTPVAIYNVNLKDVNGTAKNRDYVRNVVPAVVSIKSQSNTEEETKFVLAVDKESLDTITDVKLYVGSEATTQRGDTLAGPVSENDFIEHANLAALEYVTKITYSVNGIPVAITKADFNDFFRIGFTYAKVAIAKD